LGGNRRRGAGRLDLLWHHRPDLTGGDVLASGYWQTLLKLRLPAAMPFIFNALKINSTLALIGSIVAEFFGTPISVEIRKPMPTIG
ncbi:ABC transporter permease subunit, partial [Rhizobium ruizarguesonis]